MTSKTTHTPGPWSALYDNKRDNFQIFASGKVGMRAWIATTKCESVPAHHEANARLIAAAPDMLKALLVLRDLDVNCSMEEDRAAWTIAHAAITKACGEG